MAVPVAVLVKEQTNPMLVKAVVESEGMLGASGGLINSTFT